MLHMNKTEPKLASELTAIALAPWVLLRTWNWKTALISALFRALIFLCTNLRAGHHKALKAMLVEALYGAIAAGLLGAITQRLRGATPRWLTAITVWLALPATLLLIQFFVHRAAGTPRILTSMVASFLFAALSTGFSLFAMERGTMLVGTHRTFAEDMRALPRVLADFLLAAPRALSKKSKRNK